MDVMTNELYHYGVLGMKWGVRRYQNKDGTLTSEGVKRSQSFRNKQANKGVSRNELTQERTIPAGTKMYRTSTKSDENLSGSTYVSYLDADRNHYKGGWIRITQKSDKAYEHQYTLNTDLKLPSRQTQQEAINEVINKNGKYLHEAVKGFVDQIIPKNSWDYWEIEASYDGGIKKFVDDSVKQWRNKTPEELAYSVSQSLGLAPNVKTEIIKTLQKQGYNAMVDEASVGGQNGWRKEGYDPLIIFDSSVLTKDNTKSISANAEKRYHRKDTNWSRKVNSGKNKSAYWSAI